MSIHSRFSFFFFFKFLLFSGTWLHRNLGYVDFVSVRCFYSSLFHDNKDQLLCSHAPENTFCILISPKFVLLIIPQTVQEFARFLVLH